MEYEWCLCSFFIYLFIFMFLFFQNSVNDNDNNTNNRDCFCHDTDDSEPSSQYESVTSADGSDFQPQPQHRSICSRWFVRVCGDGFHRCGRVGAHGSRADGDGGGAHAVPTVGNQPVTWGGAHAVPTVGNQPVTWGNITDFENPKVEKLFHENEGPGRLSMLV